MNEETTEEPLCEVCGKRAVEGFKLCEEHAMERMRTEWDPSAPE